MPDDTAILAALDFPTPEFDHAPWQGRAHRRRAAGGAAGVVLLSLLLLILIIAHPFVPPFVSGILATLWLLGLGVTIYGLIRVGTLADGEQRCLRE